MGGRNGARSVLSREKDLGRCFSFGENKMANGEEEEKTLPVLYNAAKSNVDGCWEGWRGVLGFVWHESKILLLHRTQKMRKHQCQRLAFGAYQPYILAPGYLDVLLSPGPGPIIVAGSGGPMGPPRPPPPLPPRPLPRPRPAIAGMAKSGFAELASKIASSCLMGLRGPPPPYGANWPAGAPISGLQLGFTGR
jgi:hypothetical protein